MKLFFYSLLLLVLFQNAAHAKSGITSIIEQDMAQNGENFDDGYDYDSSTSASWYNIDLSFNNMKEAVESNLGVPEANYLVLILFSLAALLQMGRVISGTGDWVGFTTRVIVVLAFLRGYSQLFDGIEIFFNYLTDNILSGKTAYETFWEKQQEVMVAFDSVWDKSASIFSADVLKQGLFTALTFITSIFAYAAYILIFIVQCCLAVTLRYLGPILISLAIIPESDFTSGYITTTLQTFSWSVVAAILIKVMGTTTTLGLMANLNIQDFVAISAMNICYALAFLMIPTMTGMIFSGKGLGGCGTALTAMGRGAVVGMASWAHAKTTGKLWNGTKNYTSSLASRGATLVGDQVKTASAATMRHFREGASEIRQGTKAQVSYAVGHIKRVTPSGRAEYRHEQYGEWTGKRPFGENTKSKSG